ncbi:MAG: proline--tRNA ligase [bacterium]|nr:proline--tRNA ligase [bacterium]
MRWSKALIPTLKESPSDAEVVSHKLMVRSGMIRKVAPGIYNYLPLCFRVIEKIKDIIREEMNKAGAQELLMPILSPAELWQETGRWDIYGKELMKVEDRHKKHYALGPTHEEVITDIARKELKSYRQLPACFYQIQTKFRDEIRPRFGVMRGREFIMKDAYSFHRTEEDLDSYYKVMFKTYSDIFRRCGLKFRAVLADSGAIGGDVTHEFMVLASSGESLVLSCPDDKCGYAATSDTAESVIPCPDEKHRLSGSFAEKHTPGRKTVEEVSDFLKIKPFNLIKTLIYKTSKKPVAVLIRGDRELNTAKLKKFLRDGFVELAEDALVQKITGTDVGFAGPRGLKENIKIFADFSVKDMGPAVMGANRKDTHFLNALSGKDYQVDKFIDVSIAAAGDKCAKCGMPLDGFRGIEVGQIFKLGKKYSNSLKAGYIEENGRENTGWMGCYGIGVTRIIAAAIEQNNDDKGIIWPLQISPYHVVLMGLNMKDSGTVEVCEKLYGELTDGGVEVLFDDRDLRAGFKFKDADLIGIPIKMIVSEANLKSGSIEIQDRMTAKSEIFSLERAVSVIKERTVLSNTD